MSAISNALVTMWGKSKAHLSEAELREMSDLSDTAQFAACNLRQVVDGIGCLVLADESATNQAGNFRSADSVSTLLFSIASQIDLIDGLIQVGTEAECRLQDQQPKTSAKGAKS